MTYSMTLNAAPTIRNSLLHVKAFTVVRGNYNIHSTLKIFRWNKRKHRRESISLSLNLQKGKLIFVFIDTVKYIFV